MVEWISPPIFSLSSLLTHLPTHPPTHPPTHSRHRWFFRQIGPSPPCASCRKVPRRRRSVSHLPTHPPTHPPTHLFIHSFTHCTPTYSFNHPPTYVFIHSTAGGGGTRGRRDLCREVGLSFERMCEIQTLISQLGRDLASLGFGGGGGGREERGGADGARALLESMDERGGRAYWRLVKAAVCVGLYPNVVKVGGWAGGWVVCVCLYPSLSHTNPPTHPPIQTTRW